MIESDHRGFFTCIKTHLARLAFRRGPIPGEEPMTPEEHTVLLAALSPPLRSHFVDEAGRRRDVAIDPDEEDPSKGSPHPTIAAASGTVRA